MLALPQQLHYHANQSLYVDTPVVPRAVATNSFKNLYLKLLVVSGIIILLNRVTAVDADYNINAS